MHMLSVMSNDLDAIFAAAPLHRWADGATLFHAGDAPTALYRVTKGRVLLRRSLTDGATITLQDAFPGDVVAEASAYSAHYHCSAVAAGETEARALPMTAFRACISRDPLLAAGWAAHLARAVQSARFGIEVRSLPTVRARLDAWLSDGRALPEKGHMQEVAAEIGVSREALYRELSRRRGSSAAHAIVTTSAS